MTGQPDLVAAATFELESRGRKYPTLVANHKLTPDEATVDFQAWHCIAEYLENGRGPAGWIDGVKAEPGTALMNAEWALCEAAADRAVTSTEAALQSAGDDQAKVERLSGRLASLQQIRRRVSDQRAHVDAINRAFRARRQSHRKAA